MSKMVVDIDVEPTLLKTLNAGDVDFIFLNEDEEECFEDVNNRGEDCFFPHKDSKFTASDNQSWFDYEYDLVTRVRSEKYVVSVWLVTMNKNDGSGYWYTVRKVLVYYGLTEKYSKRVNEEKVKELEEKLREVIASLN